ncbi:unknown [Crocosphaera subtropica ATCC 51142]|uniref:N-acetyltransferase domain-containing protein n=1 Tax=Crocosphaera subtropica (strain ATCC 51142 / BH68) TaxID=43989 RepID=B1WQC1_CROS5|nr:GNAT family N-acetyltransferase [Crocosphaera subtropica]ACB50043.1 unknown [Crocosphaera subtropica ATCC 51142]
MSTDFSIRVASLEDKEVVTQLLKASYPVLMKSRYSEEHLSNILPIMTKANPFLLSSGTFYLAETKDKSVIGCGGWTKEKPGSSEIETGLGHIRHFATHPQWTRKSIGRKIYQRCEKEAKMAQIKCFECFSSLNAEGFYRALGFKSVKNIDIILVNHLKIEAVWMRRYI